MFVALAVCFVQAFSSSSREVVGGKICSVSRVSKKEGLLFQPKRTRDAYDDAGMHVPAFSLCGFLQDFFSHACSRVTLLKDGRSSFQV